MCALLLPSCLAICALLVAVRSENIPEYVKQCQLSSPKLQECLIGALHHLRPYLVTGIPEIELPTVEPFILDSLSLSLTGGERGYKITLKDINVYGLSNYTVSKVKLGQNGAPFEGKCYIPHLRIGANYTSSGVLIILPASSDGFFHGDLGDVTVSLKGFMSSYKGGDKDFLKLEKLDLNIVIKRINMRVSKVFNNNRILTEATNLFLRENGHEVLGVMMPQLRAKITNVIKKVVNQLLKYTAVQTLVKP